ncbi:MAG: MFS transporter [Myxococcota bacterium]
MAVPPPRTEPAPGRWGRALSSLHEPQFRWLFASNVAFFLAMGSQGVVRAWLAFKLTGSEFALGLVMFAVAVPMLFIAPIGGVVADRFERRNLIAAGQAVVVVSELVLLALIATDRLAFWHLLTAAGVMGCVFPFIMPARQAIVVNIVGKGGLPSAVALNMAGMNTTRVLGPAAAGFLIDLVGVKVAYSFGVGLYAIGLLCMFAVHASRPEPRDRPLSVLGSMLEGMAYARDHRVVLVLLLFGLLPMFLAMPFQNLLVVFAEEIWDEGSRGLGLLSAAAGMGGVIGSIWVASRASASRRLVTMMVSMFAFGSLLLAFSVSPWFLLALPLVLVANIFASVFGTLNNTAIQLLIPDHVRGRISSFLMMSFSLPLLGTLPMAAVAEARGAPFAVALAAALAMAVAVLFYLASPSLRGMDRSVKEALAAGGSSAGGGRPH